MGTQILSQENFESNGHLSRNLSKFGPAELQGARPSQSRGGARRGKVGERRSPPLAPQSATKAASHQGKTLGPSPARPRATCGPPMSLGSQTLSASGPGPSRPLRARRTAPERAPSERHRSAITTRPQPCRASNTCSHKAGGSERHGRRGAGLSTSCVFLRMKPGARWLRTC